MRKDAEAGVALLKVRAAHPALAVCADSLPPPRRKRQAQFLWLPSPFSTAAACLGAQGAAAEGNGMALYSLGLCHWRGEGTPVDFTAARECLNSAADQGVLMAADVLVMLEAGGGEG